MPNKFAILVVSCDSYSDLWGNYFQSFEKNWGFSNKVYLMSNFTDFKHEKVSVLKIGEDKSWSQNLFNALNMIDEEVVLMTLEDLFLIDKIDHKNMDYLIRRFISEDMNYLRLNPTPGPDGPVDKDGIGEVDPMNYYRASTIMSLWNRKVLIQLLAGHETAWEFELYGSRRSFGIGGWYASSKFNTPFVNLVIKGKYELVAYNTLRNLGYLPSNQRKKMSVYNFICYRLIIMRSIIFRILIKPRYRAKIRSFFHPPK